MERHLKVILVLLAMTTLMVFILTILDLVSPRYPDNMVVQCAPMLDYDEEFIEVEKK